MPSDPNPNEMPPGTDNPEEFQELAQLVAEALARGDDRNKVIADLANNGWEQDAAEEMVTSVEQALQQQQHAAQNHGDGGGMGWLVYIGILLLINFLSWAFNWGFWIY